MRHLGKRSQRRQGATMVEMALLMPLFLLLLFGILEFGWLIKDCLGLNQAAREGARVAAVGAMTADIAARVQSQAPTLDTTQLVWRSGWSTSTPGIYGRVLRYNNYTGTFLAPEQLGDDTGSSCNTAKSGDQIGIMVTYEHQLVTGAILAWLADSDKPGVVTLHSHMVIRRE
jgi:Flp pilus assembly protein TadG